MAVRLALGASRGRLVRQLLTESLCLATLGGVIGLATAFLLREGLLRLVSDTPIALPAALDVRLLAFVFVLTLVSGLFLGLLPAMRITKAEAVTGLREQGRGIAGSIAWLRIGKAVVIGQLALSLPLLVGAGLLVRTLVNLQRVDLGYPKDNLLTLRVDAQGGRATTRPGRPWPSRRCSSASARSPAFAAPPFRTTGCSAAATTATRSTSKATRRKGTTTRGSRYDQIGPGYFSTLGVPILLGREITADDRPADAACASSTRRSRSTSSPGAIRSACT